MLRKLVAVSIIVLVLSLAFASVSSAQTGAGNQDQGQNNQNQGQSNQGASPSSAFTSLGQGRSVAPGQRHWYAFQYAGDSSPIQVRLRNAANLMFSVWTQTDIQNANGNFGTTANPVGRSTPNSQFGDDQYWTGAFNTPGTYYVMVERVNGGNTDNAGGTYGLEITGSGVSFRGNQQGQNNQAQAGNQQGQGTTGGSNTNASGSTSGSGSNAPSGVTPTTLPRTGGDTASVFPMLIGGMGALGVAAGALLRRKK